MDERNMEDEVYHVKLHALVITLIGSETYLGGSIHHGSVLVQIIITLGNPNY